MRGKLKILFTLGFIVAVFCAFGISASALGNDYGTSVPYEPNGTTSVEYEFSASECNRTLVVKCYDQDTGQHIKTINYKTKHGEDTIIVAKIYGYRLTKFSSDQGLLETCKLWDGSSYQIYGEIDIDYYFRTALSKETVTATVYMKKFVPVKFTERHFLFVPTGTDLSLGYGYYDEVYSRDMTLKVGDYVSLGGSYTGFSMRSNYSQYISGNFSYKWCDDYRKNFGVPYTDKSWDIIKATCDESERYTTFDESKDGHYTYCTNLVSCIDFYFNRNQYTVTFNANGGSGSLPASQTQYYEYNVTIGTETPVRSGYTFKGWSKSSTATTPSYYPGGTYTMGLNQTLYAVWEVYDYEFSISNLRVDEVEIFPNSVITVRVRTDSWDLNDAYDDVPVDLYYDGTLLTTQLVDFAPYGAANLTFKINVGTLKGTHVIETRINWDKRGIETNPNNNTVSIVITVKNDEYSFGITALTGNARYRENTEVITSYLVSNDSERKVLPDANAKASFTTYCYNGEEKVILGSAVWNGLVIPVGESNLIYFKWRVPDGMADVTVHCECTVNPDGALKENNRDNNTATLSTVIAARLDSQTTDPSYESGTPSGYTRIDTPAENTGSASWTEWVYENGSFSQKKYGLKISSASPEVAPGSNCESAEFLGGVWTLKSGYGITLTYDGTLATLGGSNLPSTNAYTAIQTVYVTFPEYQYSTEEENIEPWNMRIGRGSLFLTAVLTDRKEYTLFPYGWRTVSTRYP